MSLSKFGIIVVLAGLLGFFLAAQMRSAALESEEDRTREFNPSHLYSRLTTSQQIVDDLRWQEDRTADEKKRHEKQLAEIESDYWKHVVIAWLLCAGVGFVFTKKGRSGRVGLATAASPTPAPEPAKPIMVSCECNACAGKIQFNEDGFDYRNPPTVTCPHCGQDTTLYIPSTAPQEHRT